MTMTSYRCKAGVNLILPDRPQGCLLLIKLLVHPEWIEGKKRPILVAALSIDNVYDIDLLGGVGRALCLDKIGENNGEAHSNIEVVLHHKVFLIGKQPN